MKPGLGKLKRISTLKCHPLRDLNHPKVQLSWAREITTILTVILQIAIRFFCSKYNPMCGAAHEIRAALRIGKVRVFFSRPGGATAVLPRTSIDTDVSMAAAFSRKSISAWHRCSAMGYNLLKVSGDVAFPSTAIRDILMAGLCECLSSLLLLDTGAQSEIFYVPRFCGGPWI
jgi:hypothetical protein